MRLLLCLAGWLSLTSLVHAADLRIATFNTESDDDTQPAKVAETIAAIGSFDVLVVQEVESWQALKEYTEAAAKQGGKWRFVISESGINADRQADLLGIIYRTDMFRQLETSEIHVIRSKPDGSKYGKPDWSLRGALSLRLLDLRTGAEFRVVTVHLKCCNEPTTRAHQTALLVDELARSNVPTIVLGDTNIPIDPSQSQPDSANLASFENLSSKSGRKWLVPGNPVKTQCSPEFNSMLDQIYVPEALTAASTAEVLLPDAGYCDKDELGYSDHRPVVARLVGLTDRFADAAPHSMALDEANSEARLEARESDLQSIKRVGDVSVQAR